MRDVAKFLMKKYYSSYKCPEHIKPTSEGQLVLALDLCKDKVMVIHEDGKIKGVGIFLTLSDEVYRNINSFDMTNMDDLAFLLADVGKNIHFILVCGEGTRDILKGIKIIKKRTGAKTVSWWNPGMTHLHKYSFS